ncbi:MAG: ATP-binding cassette domain-containing protein [Burkholderiales bacterium]
MQAALQAQDLRKRYGERQAVGGVSFNIRPGELLALLGPNGAGKSTTLGMIAGLTVPDSGQVQLSGQTAAQDRNAYQRRIGWVPQEIALFEPLSAQANVELFGALYGLSRATLRERVPKVLAQVGLLDRAQDAAAQFSGGMKRRRNIACALGHDPDVLLREEPTAGVDPQSRNAIFDTLEALKREGKALLYTTHYMEEAERLADRIVIVDHGQVVAEGSLPELLRRLPAALSIELSIEGQPDPVALQALPGVRQVQMTEGRLKMSLDELAAPTERILQALQAQGVQVTHLSSGRATLEDVFLALTGRQLRD